MAQRLKYQPPMRETRVQSLDREDTLEKEMATHSSILAWRIPWTEEPGGLQSTGSQRVGHDSVRLHCHFHGASQVALVLKNFPSKAGDTRDAGSVPGLGRSKFYLFLPRLGLHCCTRAYSRQASRSFSLVVGWRASVVAAQGALSRRLSNCHWRAPQGRFSSGGGLRISCSGTCTIFLDQGSNPRSLLWQTDS